jgi:outer membrane autotransporter protein
MDLHSQQGGGKKLEKQQLHHTNVACRAASAFVEALKTGTCPKPGKTPKPVFGEFDVQTKFDRNDGCPAGSACQTGGRNSARFRLTALLATTALAGFLPATVFAQVIIDGGATETVIGGGGGTQASPWNIADQLFVGDGDTGVLEISNGGSGGIVTSEEAYMGRTSTGNGTVTVDGSGSDWTSSAQIWVGYDGIGALTISGGASVSDTTGNIAFGTASTGTVVVTGAGSSWESDNTIYVSEGGTGYLTVSSGASVTVGPVGGAIRIANDAGANGEATVTGAGSNLGVADGTLSVGYGGAGVLNIRDTATVTADDAYIGYTGTAIGTVNIESGGILDLSASGSDLTIGRFSGSQGTLNIANGLVDVGSATTLGDRAGSEGTIEISSASGQLETRNIYVGDAGDGTLNVSDGTVTVGVGMTVGTKSGSDGRVVNVGGTISIGFDLSVGDAGTGAVTIENGGTLTTSGFVNVGEIGGVGTLTVSGTGSVWQTGNTTYVGTGGTGNIVISDGATVTDGDFALYLGSHDSAGSGTLRISDAAWNNVGQVALGGDAGSRGELTIEAGGSLSSNDHVFVGDLGDGVASIVGTGSELTASGGLYLGNSIGGTGVLTVADGGQVVIGDNITIAADDGTVGTINVTDGSSRMVAGNELLVGDIGEGTLNIVDGSVHADSAIYLGYDPDGEGTVLVRGSTASLSSNSWIFIAEEGTGSLSISDGGTVSVSGRAYLGFDPDSDGTLNIGASAGAAAQGAGNLDAAELWFGDHEDAKLYFNHTDSSYVFAANMSGEGRIYHISGETILSGDSSSFSGTTSVTGGSLHVSGKLGGNVAMNGGVLGGSGTLSGLVSMGSGSVLEPGNSIGTLNVSNFAFNAGSVYEVELNDGGFVAGTNNDLLSASGTVTINAGTIHVTPENGSDDGMTYAVPGTYNIITASSVAGTFDGVTDDYVFLDFIDSYDAANVYLTSEQAIYFSDIAETSNQRAIAPVLEALGSGNAVHDALLGIAGNADDARAALDSLTGEIHVSVNTALLEDSRFPREAAIDRLRVALGSVGADSSAQITDRISGSFGLWGQGFGAWSRWNGDGNADTMDRTIGGFLIGGDAMAWNHARFGVLGGYSRSSYSVDDRASSGTADTYTLGAYGGGEWDFFTLLGGLAHSWHSLDTARSVAFTGFSDNMSASYGARTLQAWGEAAYGFEAGAARLEPFANLAYVNLSTDGFTETGGTAALTADSNVHDATYTTLGLRAETDVPLGKIDASFRGMLGWRHVFGDAPTSQMAFASGGDAFTTTGVPLVQDSLVLDAAFEMYLTDDAMFGIAYGGLFGSEGQDHSAKASLNVRF